MALSAVTAAAPTARARAPNPQLVVNGVTTTVGDAMNAAFGRRMVTASGVTVTIPQLQSGASTGFDQFTGPDAVVIGGAALPDQPPGMPVGDPALPSALDVIGAPYGSYNAGCVLCVFTSPQQITSDRAGIDGIDYRQGAGVIPQLGGNDAVGFYEQVENLPARFVLDVDHYTSGAVYLKTPLTAEQMSLLRTNMYLVTNSVDPTVSTSTATADGLPLVNLMEGFVSGWDPNGTFISVAGWAAATGGNGASGQVPNTGTLDTYWSNYGIPVVWVGAPTKMFGRNLYMAYNGAASEGQSTSLIRHFEGEEMDFRYTAASPGEVSFHGITISPAPLGGIGPAALGSGSYELYLAGAMPDHLLIDSGPYDREIRGNGFMSFGDGGATSAFTNPEMFEHDGYVDGANRLRLVGSLTKASSTVGWTSTSLGLGLTVDGTPGSPSSGTYEGGIVWNGGAANVGGLALCGGSGTCGVSVAANGTLRLGENEGGLRTVTGLTDDNVGSTVVAGEFDTYSDSNQNRLMTWTRRGQRRRRLAQRVDPSRPADRRRSRHHRRRADGAGGLERCRRQRRRAALRLGAGPAASACGPTAPRSRRSSPSPPCRHPNPPAATSSVRIANRRTAPAITPGSRSGGAARVGPMRSAMHGHPSRADGPKPPRRRAGRRSRPLRCGPATASVWRAGT